MMLDLFRLIRWKNLLMLFLVIWLLQHLVISPILQVNYGVAPEYMISASAMLMLMLLMIFEAAGGYIINDYFDIKIDAINRPDSQIVSKTVTRQQAMLYYQITTGIGVVCGIVAAYLLRNFTIGLVVVFVPGLLWFYSSTYKRVFLVGNLIVALTTALVPLLLAMANVSALEKFVDPQILYQTSIPATIYKWMLAFALFAFMLTLIREIIKDMQDQVGDRELECHTIPIVLGNTVAKIVVICLMALTIGLLVLAYVKWIPYEIGWGSANMNYMLCFAVLWLVAIVVFVRSNRSADYGISATMVKILMGWGLVYTLIFFIQICQQVGQFIPIL